MNTRSACAVATGALIVLLGMTAGCAVQGDPVRSPNEIPSGELVERPRVYDGREVTFEGEVIGEAMVRGDMAWLHLNDDAYHQLNTEEGTPLGGYNSGMAVWLPAEQTHVINRYGDHSNAGDVVRVVGTFNAACGMHGGDMDIHAVSLDVLTAGRRVREPLDTRKAAWAVILVLSAIAAYAAASLGARRRQDAGR